MSGQDTGYEEICVNCGDGLVAEVNWNVGDVAADIRYCTKDGCQQAKPGTHKFKAYSSKTTEEKGSRSRTRSDTQTKE